MMVKRAFTLSLLSFALCCCTESVTRRDKPLSLADVSRLSEMEFPFPDSAHDIYYATYSDFLAPFELLVRFDAPSEDCVALIPKVLAWHQRGGKVPEKFRPVAITSTTQLPSSGYLNPVRWWDDTVIHHGFFAGEDSSHTPAIWVDSDAGRFYFRVTD